MPVLWLALGLAQRLTMTFALYRLSLDQGNCELYPCNSLAYPESSAPMCHQTMGNLMAQTEKIYAEVGAENSKSEN